MTAPVGLPPAQVVAEVGARHDFRWRSLGWTQTRNVYVIWVGHDIIALETQLDAANKHIAQLEEQLKQAQQEPAPTETPQPDPKATEALTALAELAKALKLIGEAAA